MAEHECGICLEAFSDPDSYVLGACGHALHHPCLAATVVARVGDGTLDLRCFESGCGAPIIDTDIALLSDPATLARLQRVRAQRADPTLRFCACGAAVPGGTPRSPLLRCAACGAEFCWLHAVRHAPGAAACAAFIAAEAADPANAASLAAVRSSSKPCPNEACGAAVQRDGGCNSVVCSACGTSFCWLCGQRISSGELPIHYQWCALGAPAAPPNPHFCALSPSSRLFLIPGNLRSGCRFSQFGAARATTPGQQALFFLFTVVYGALFGVPAALLVLVICIVFACCSVPVFLRDPNPLVLFATWSGIVSWILAVAVLVVVSLPLAAPFGVAVMLAAMCGCVRLPRLPPPTPVEGTAAAPNDDPSIIGDPGPAEAPVAPAGERAPAVDAGAVVLSVAAQEGEPATV
jgi:hypothetical protein